MEIKKIKVYRRNFEAEFSLRGNAEHLIAYGTNRGYWSRLLEELRDGEQMGLGLKPRDFIETYIQENYDLYLPSDVSYVKWLSALLAVME